jgi:hypothetical protein
MDADWAVRTVHTDADVAGPYMMYNDVAKVMWQFDWLAVGRIVL